MFTKYIILFSSGGICEIFNTKKGVPENFFKIMKKANDKGCMMAATIDVSLYFYQLS